MPELKATRIPKTYSVEDGEKRGPLTMARVRFHPTARFVLGQCADRRLALWNLDAAPKPGKKGESVVGSLVCPHAAGRIRGFDLAPSGEWLVSGGSDRRLKLWKWDTDGLAGEATLDVAAHDGWVEAVAVSPDGQRIASVGADRKVKLWDAGLRMLRSAPAHANYPRDAAFTPDGKWLVTCGEDGVAVVWDAATLEVVRSLDTGLTSEQQGQTPALGGIVRMSIAHDGRWLALAGDRQTFVYELPTGKAVGAITQAGGDAAFARKLNILGVGSDQLRLLSFEFGAFQPRVIEPKVDPRGKTPGTWPVFPAREIVQIKRGDFSFGVAFSPDDRAVAVGKTDGTLELWSLT